MRTLAFAAALALTAAAGSLVQAQTPPSLLLKVEDLTRVSPHVQIIPDNSIQRVSNVGFVVGTKAILIVDTGLGPKNGLVVAGVAQKLAPGKTLYLVATHAHPEHDYGAPAIPAAKFIRSEAQNADRTTDEDTAKRFIGAGPEVAAMVEGGSFRPADITFKDSYTLDLGGVHVVMTPLGPAHTPGDTAIWVVEDKTLFSGDLAMKAQPALNAPTATLATWAHALDFLEAYGAKVVVPSHGPVGDPGYIRGYRAYLKEVAERTAAAKAGGANELAAAEAVWQAMSPRFPDRARMNSAVHVAYVSG